MSTIEKPRPAADDLILRQVTGILRDATVFGVRSRESQPNSPESAASNLLNSARVPRSRSAGVSRPSK